MSGFARIAVPRPLFQTFLYRIPAGLSKDVVPGARVVVPFGRKQLTGWVNELIDAPDSLPRRVHEILDVPDPQPALSADLLDLCRWVARYYVAPLGLTIRAALPAALTAESAVRLSLRPGVRAAELPDSQAQLLDYLRGLRGPVKLSTVRKSLGPGAWTSAARMLAERGFIEIRQEAPSLRPPTRTRQVVALTHELATLQERANVFKRARRQRELYEYLETVGGRAEVAHLAERLGISRSVVRGLVEKGVAEIRVEELRSHPFSDLPAPPEVTHTPTAAQALAIERLLGSIGNQPPGVFVLKGVTGSGKTLVYIEILRELVGRRGRGAIVLVPEISLTPQTLSRFRAAFGDDVVLLHSALSDGERYAAWQALRAGEKRIAIGARSAVFAPVRRLGVIIIDEEHEGTYKQSDPAPRYHAREVAVMRARRAGALCLLGSATPSLESWWRTASGIWQRLELAERIGARPLPAIHTVDLRTPSNSRGGDGSGRPSGPIILSSALRSGLRDRLARGEQAILLLNRRGYSNFAQCGACGAVRTCWQCNVSLTQHRRPPRLVCHHCNHQEPLPKACPECGAPDLRQRGVGTEQVERVLEETFPEARLARMDVDTTSGKWSHHEILERVSRHQVDILLGTQMIAKGLDFPNVTLVGVINADVGLNLPDFRASERTFQLLTQVAGRAGRGTTGGDVIVQTALPGHYAVRYSIDHDFDGFAAREIEERREPLYPPHTHLANLVFSGRAELRVQRAADVTAHWIAGLVTARRLTGVDLLGPAPCPIDRIRGRWRWHLLLKSRQPDALGKLLRYFARRFEPPATQVRIEIDRDPVSLL